MKTYLFIPVIVAAVLLSAASVRADLGHSWDSGSELPAAVDTAPSDSSDSAENTEGGASSSLDDQIADLLDDESLASSSSSALDLSALMVPLSEDELLRDRLAVEIAAEVAADAEAPSTPDASAPVGASDTAFATGTDRIATRSASAFAVRGADPSEDSSPSFIAFDNSANEPYASQRTWNRGDNGGAGFGEWRLVGSAEPNRSLDQGFAIYANADAGEAAIGRSFDNNTALESGSFSVDANHDFASSFSGFAIYGGDGGTDSEIFRWGVTTTEDREHGTGDTTGFWYAFGTGGQHDYRLLAEYPADKILDARLTYSLTWSTISGGLSLKITDAAGEISVSESWDNVLTDSSAVTAIAAIVAGTTDKDTLHFDNLKVTGRAVPEPATLALLLLGALALHPFRRR